MKNSAVSKTELKAFRQSHGLTQRQMAELCSVSVRTYEDWEYKTGISAGYYELLTLKLDKKGEKV